MEQSAPAPQRGLGALSLITLTSDFGLRDWYVASMRGVILRLNPHATIVDITHEISPADINSASFIIEQSSKEFPFGTIHVAVVDPEVGSQRRPLIAECDGQIFIGPDNGILMRTLSNGSKVDIFEISNPDYRSSAVSHTFHGRDIFAPAAAFRSRGAAIETFGPRLTLKDCQATLPAIWSKENSDTGTIIYIDHYGNAITDIRATQRIQEGTVKIVLKTETLSLPLMDYYAQTAPGEPLALVGSSGFIEIAVNQGNAASSLGLEIGTRIRVEPPPSQ